MRILVSKKPETLARAVGESVYRQHLGLLMSAPRSRYTTEMEDIVWGMDNGRFVCWNASDRSWHPDRWDRHAFIRLMEAKRHIPGCRFVVAPDVLCNAQATIEEFFTWRDLIRGYGYPVALAAQDGVTLGMIPWGAFDALFIGGSNAFKFSLVCRVIIYQARRQGLWVHWGRASTSNFLHYCKTLQVNSIDGSAFARFQNNRLPKMLQVLAHDQLSLFNWRFP